MSPEQNKILCYFIEEAKEHLHTIEQGLLHLSSMVADADQISEVFRAAHSIKGSAAMLGLNSIQKIAHGLEDCLKILKEVSVDVDQKLESLLLEVFDSLNTLLADLSSANKLSEPETAQISEKCNPIIQELITHLEGLNQTPRMVSDLNRTVPKPATRAAPTPSVSNQPVSPSQPTLEEDSALQLIFKSDIPKLLQQMLETFQQPDAAISRQQLGEICRNLLQAGETFELQEWNELIQTITVVCQNPQKTYQALAPIILKEIKQARQLVLTGKRTEIYPSEDLKLLVPTGEKENSAKNQYSINLDPENFIKMSNNSSEKNGNESLNKTRESSSVKSLNKTQSQGAMNQQKLQNPSQDQSVHQPTTKGPEVGAAELNSLADLFESEDLEMTGWDEEFFEESPQELDLEILSDSADSGDSEDFSDLLLDEEESHSEDFSDLLLDGEESHSEDFSDFLLDEDDLDVTNPNEVDDEATWLQDNDDGDFLDEMSRLTNPSINSSPENSSDDLENLISQADDSFEDLFDLDETDESSVNSSSVAAVEDLNTLFDEASDEELDLNWEHEVNPLDLRASTKNENPIGSNDAAADDLDLSLFDDLSVSDDPESPIASDVDEILAIDESDNSEDELSYDDLFSIDTDNEVASHSQKQSSNQAGLSATESLDDLFGDLSDSQDNNLELLVDETPESSDDFADIFGDNETELESLGEPETPSALLKSAESFDDWLNLDLAETEDNQQEKAEFSELDDLFNDDQLSSESEPLMFEEVSEESTDSLFDDDLGLNELELVDESKSTLFDMDVDANDVTEDTDLDGLLGLDLNDAHESDSSDSWDDLLSSDTTNLFDEEEVIESESTSNQGQASEDFSDLDNLLDQGVNDSASSTVNFAELEEILDDSSAPSKVDFAELEALLAQAPENSEPVWLTELQELLGEKKSTNTGSSRSTQNGSAGGDTQPPSGIKPNRGLMKVPVKQLDNLGNLIGELVVNRNTLEQDQERMRQFLDNLLHQIQNLTDVGQRMQDLYERVLLEIALLSSRRQNHHFMPEGSAQMSNSAGHDLSVFEMDKFTPFHTLAQEILELIVRVKESASDIEFLVDETDQVTRQLRQITNKLQEGINKARMVPFSNITDRMPLGIRNNSIKLGKQVELMVEGADTLIDKMILENLGDPMTHLVNNALAHGIEVPEERQKKGKAAKGRITVRAFHQGNQTVISVSDDGAGIDAERIKAKALEKGLITPEDAKNLSRLEVYDLLFAPGFSMKTEIDELSGRGVGMDVVRTNLSAIRGVINIDSTLGKGTSFTIRVPLAFSISKALICISDRARIAFPMDGVEDMLDVPRDKIQTTSEDDTFIPWRDTTLPFRPMRDLLVYHRHLGRGSVFGGNADDDIISVVVLRSAGNYLALQVDQVLGEQEIVIKQLEGPVPKPVGIAGATVMGDGRIVAIADVLELIDLAAGRIDEKSRAILPELDDFDTPEQTTVLIVDDSITVRELLSMTFNKAGYRVEQARDGQEAWEKLKSGLPCDIVFCDIEMPRMDGLQLLSHLQKDSQLSRLPMAMLTSRGAKKHMQMAIDMGARGYFTKPYLEEALLEAASRMLKGEVLVTSNAEV